MLREKKQEQIKKKIIDALIKLFEEKSIDEMITTEIAKKASVSKRTLYKYFSSKKEMYLAIVEEAFKKLQQHRMTALDNLGSEDSLLILEHTGREYLNFCVSHPVESKIMLGYDQSDYVDEFPEQTDGIGFYANQIEVNELVEAFIVEYNLQYRVDANAVTLFLWSQIEGFASLLSSKKKWLEYRFEMDYSMLIDKNMELIKFFLIGLSYEK